MSNEELFEQRLQDIRNAVSNLDFDNLATDRIYRAINEVKYPLLDHPKNSTEPNITILNDDEHGYFRLVFRGIEICCGYYDTKIGDTVCISGSRIEDPRISFIQSLEKRVDNLEKFIFKKENNYE